MSKINVLMLCKDKKIKKIKKRYDDDNSFKYKKGEYEIIPDRIFMYKFKPTLIYFEGCPQPIDFTTLNKKNGETQISISSEDIHKFASKRILSVLATLNSDNLTFMLLIIVVLLQISNIIIGLVI